MQPPRRTESAKARATAIIDILLQREYVTVGDLAATLMVSEATIRKDLGDLEQQGLVRRTHGGAAHRREQTLEVRQFYEHRQLLHTTEKDRIGQAAARRIRTGQIIAFTGGSTPLYVVRHIPTDVTFTAISNDLEIIRILSENERAELFVPGGYLRLGRDGLVGPSAIAALQEFTIDQVFLTVTGLDIKLGATAGHISNVVYLRELIGRARQCVVVADHSKFDNPPQIVICSWEKIHVLITDDRILPFQRQQIEAKGVEVQVV